MKGVEEIVRGLSEIDIERLCDLIDGYDHRAKFGWETGIDGRLFDGVAPIDCGGSNSSDHSYRFTKLTKLGLAEHRKRGFPWGRAPSRGYRGSKVYRPTELGRAVRASLTQDDPK